MFKINRMVIAVTAERARPPSTDSTVHGPQKTGATAL
jgi:hypothetical protein